MQVSGGLTRCGEIESFIMRRSIGFQAILRWFITRTSLLATRQLHSQPSWRIRKWLRFETPFGIWEADPVLGNPHCPVLRNPPCSITGVLCPIENWRIRPSSSDHTEYWQSLVTFIECQSQERGDKWVVGCRLHYSSVSFTLSIPIQFDMGYTLLPILLPTLLPTVDTSKISSPSSRYIFLRSRRPISSFLSPPLLFWFHITRIAPSRCYHHQ